MKARVICNPAASGGGYDPEELRQELEDYEPHADHHRERRGRHGGR
ncbi:MAG: hypothetical protein WKF67_10300 [Rubrobacteraceae bacterium]